jgi:hypothetical protein
LLELLGERCLLGLGRVAGATVLLVLTLVGVGHVRVGLGKSASGAQTGSDSLDVALFVVLVVVLIVLVKVHGHTDELQGGARNLVALVDLRLSIGVDGGHGNPELVHISKRLRMRRFEVAEKLFISMK